MTSTFPLTSANKTGGLSASNFSIVRSTRTSRAGLYTMIPVLIGLIALPYLLGSGVQQTLVQLFILIILGTMWNLLAGYAGMMSIGQQAFIGLGAYGLVYTANEFGLNPFLAIVFAGIVAGLVSLPVSFVVFRFVGGYFAIGTWVIAEIIMGLVSRSDQLGGGIGLTLGGLGDYSPGRRIAYIYWLALAVVILAIAITYVLLRSRVGAGLTAVRDDTTAAASLGVPVVRIKRIAYVVAAVGCGLAGGLIAITSQQVQPASIFSLNYAVYMIFIAVIGGVGSIEGPIVGAVVFFALQQWLSPLGTWYLVILGAVGIAITLFMPGGIWGTVERRWHIRLFPVGYRLKKSEGSEDA